MRSFLMLSCVLVVMFSLFGFAVSRDSASAEITSVQVRDLGLVYEVTVEFTVSIDPNTEDGWSAIIGSTVVEGCLEWADSKLYEYPRICGEKTHKFYVPTWLDHVDLEAEADIGQNDPEVRDTDRLRVIF